jgi:hypothetical protein
MKHCYKCKETKETTEFYKDKSKPGGLEGLCKVCCKVKRQAWSRNNPEKEYARWLRRQVAKAQRAVEWHKELTDLVVEEGLDACKRLEKLTGVVWHLDHIVPLRGKTVSGLHVWNNFQLLPASVNIRKGNKWQS